MLRVLAVRQGLLALSAALGVLFLLVLLLIVRQGFRAEVTPVSFDTRDGVAVGDGLKLAQVRGLDVYGAIGGRHLFGDAGAYAPGKQAAPPPTPPPTDTAEETKLPLTLFGTTLSEGPNPRAAAIIDVRASAVESGTKTFYIGDEVMSEVLLHEVHPASVILENRRENRRELLQIDWKFTNSGLSVATSRPVQSAVAVNRPNLITLDRAGITKRVEEEYARVASSLDVKVVNGPDGNVQGITTDNIEQYDVARELGFKNGDILVSVNNEPVRSREDAVNVVKKYQSASIFRVGVMRGGSMQYITYRIR